MRIYSDCRELMSEMGRELNSYGVTVKPKTYQNKTIQGNEDYHTKEIICQQYCLTSLDEEDYLFVFTHTKEWAAQEMAERISNHQINPGYAWELNKGMWEQFLTKEGKFDYTYSERINRNVQPYSKYNDYCSTALKEVIELLKNDPDTRKAIITIFTGSDMGYYNGEKRIPCSMYYDFLIRDNAKGEKQLNICYHQRSSDFCMHFGDDVYLAFKLMQYVAAKVGVKPGYLYHTIDSLHAYKKDWELLKSNIDDLMEN